MKKVLSILLVLCIAATLFAATGLTVKGGAAFDILYQKTAKDDEAPHEYAKINDNGFGFDLGIQYDINDSLLVFADVNMVFPKDGYIKDGNDTAEMNKWLSLSDCFKEAFTKFDMKIRFFNLSAGVAYKLDFNPVKLAVGAGFTFNRAAVNVAVDKEDALFDTVDAVKMRITNVGITCYIDAKYMVAENIGVGLTLLPQLNIYNIYSYAASKTGTVIEDSTHNTKGFAVGFAMPIALGVSYSF